MMTGSRAGRNGPWSRRANYDAQDEYWKLVLDQLSGSPDEERRKQAESNRDRARNWVARLPDKEEKPADPKSWFAVGRAADLPGDARVWAGHGRRTSMRQAPLLPSTNRSRPASMRFC